VNRVGRKVRCGNLKGGLVSSPGNLYQQRVDEDRDVDKAARNEAGLMSNAGGGKTPRHRFLSRASHWGGKRKKEGTECGSIHS